VAGADLALPLLQPTAAIKANAEIRVIEIDRISDCFSAPSRAKVKAASRPIFPPVPVMMQTFLESLFDMVLLPDLPLLRRLPQPLA
jgi:hypothetical protein